MTADDVVLLSRPSETFNIVSYRVRVATADIQKSLSPAVWPLRVHVREFIHYRKQYSDRNAAERGEKMNVFDGSTAIGSCICTFWFLIEHIF